MNEFIVDSLTFESKVGGFFNDNKYNDFLSFESFYIQKQAKDVIFNLNILKIYNKKYYHLNYEKGSYFEKIPFIKRKKINYHFEYSDLDFYIEDSDFKRMKTYASMSRIDYSSRKRTDNFFKQTKKQEIIFESHNINRVSFLLEYDVIAYFICRSDNGLNEFVAYNYVNDIVKLEYNKNILYKNLDKGDAIVKVKSKEETCIKNKKAENIKYKYMFYINNDLYCEIIILSPMYIATDKALRIEKRHGDDFIGKEIFSWEKHLKFIDLYTDKVL
ncbi:hypothetical protein OKW22_001415 [Bacilli bacterium PM5-3]|nr:hypothetical protein [Bacilli bacterium PM5-3]MDH6603365.1 hypothetical protein [Bacilli bacterium PM5-9]